MRTRAACLDRCVTLALTAVAAWALSAILAATATATKAPVPTKDSWGEHEKAQAQGELTARAPVSGIYDACSPAEPKSSPLPECQDRLLALRQGGFRVVLNYWTSVMSVDENLQYADQAHAVGMQVIWNLSDYRAPLEEKLELVRATASHPATWGYYIGDEVRPEDRWEVEQLSAAVRALTGKPLMLVSRPSPALLKPFTDLADYVGPDSYPDGPFDPPTCQTSRWASRMVENQVMVLQAFSWSIDYPALAPDWPSAGEMRKMRDQATRCGRPKLLMWFCFHCITDYHPNPDGYWRKLTWAANGVRLRPNYRMSSVSF
jgi:hypothetical protein